MAALMMFDNCQNAWCGLKMSYFQRRQYKSVCHLCETEKVKWDNAQQMALALGNYDRRIDGGPAILASPPSP